MTTKDLTKFILFRLSSIIIIQTFYVPDEYFQSLEVAHNMVFNYGFLTWEWRNGLRTYLYPSIIAVSYKILQVLNWDIPVCLILFPRILQAVLTAVSDYYFLLWCNQFGCEKLWIKLAIFTNWFWYYCGSRTIVNSFETSITQIALYYYPWSLLEPRVKEKMAVSLKWSELKRRSFIYFTLVAVNCYIRPTSLVLWGPLVLYHFWCTDKKELRNLIYTVALPTGLFVLIVAFSIDCIYYGALTLTPLNFLISNVYHDIASFYGTHPYLWYFYVGIPVVLGLYVVPFILAFLEILPSYFTKIKKTHQMASLKVIWNVLLVNLFVFSWIPHKEFRFILQLTPLMMLLTVKYLSNLTCFNTYKYAKVVTVSLFIITFLSLILFFGLIHQRGTLDVMVSLSNIAYENANSSFLFLMPCHSTPLYSYLHVDVPVKFLTCEPPLSSSHYVETDEFYKNPEAWLENYWNSNNAPTHVICYDSISDIVFNFLKRRNVGVHNFRVEHIFHHTFLPEGRVGRNVVLIRR